MTAAKIDQNYRSIMDVTFRSQGANSPSKVRQDSPLAFPKTASNDEEHCDVTRNNVAYERWNIRWQLSALTDCVSFSSLFSCPAAHSAGVLQSFSSSRSSIVLRSFSAQSSVIHHIVLRLFVIRFLVWISLLLFDYGITLSFKEKDDISLYRLNLFSSILSLSKGGKSFA